MIWEVDEKTDTLEGLDAQGRPDPAYAAGLGLVAAPFGRRSLAFVIDVAIWLVLQLPLWVGAGPLLAKLANGSISLYGLVNHPGFTLAVVMAAISVALLLVYAIAQWILHGRKGLTIGKAVTGIRTVNVRSLERPGVWWVLWRFVVVGAAGVLPVVGPALVLSSSTFDLERRGRGWHDHTARTWLVDIRAGLNPYDEKRMRIARKTVKAEPVPERSSLPSLATAVNADGSPQYRPGTRISAGVLGVARPHEPRRAPAPAAPVGAGTAPDRPSLATPTAVVAPAPAALVTPPLAAATPPPAAPVPAPAHAAPAEPSAARLAPVVAQPEPVVAHPVLSLRLDSGETLAVVEALLLGRDPDVARVPGARAVAVPDTTRSLSKTHFSVCPAAGGIEIVDRHSTNGSVLVRAGVEYPLPADTPVIAAPGDRILLGDRWMDVVPT